MLLQCTSLNNPVHWSSARAMLRRRAIAGLVCLADRRDVRIRGPWRRGVGTCRARGEAMGKRAECRAPAFKFVPRRERASRTAWCLTEREGRDRRGASAHLLGPGTVAVAMAVAMASSSHLSPRPSHPTTGTRTPCPPPSEIRLSSLRADSKRSCSAFLRY